MLLLLVLIFVNIDSWMFLYLLWKVDRLRNRCWLRKVILLLILRLFMVLLLNGLVEWGIVMVLVWMLYLFDLNLWVVRLYIMMFGVIWQFSDILGEMFLKLVVLLKLVVIVIGWVNVVLVQKWFSMIVCLFLLVQCVLRLSLSVLVRLNV